MSKLIKYIVVWHSYLEWRATRPFDSEVEAERHIRDYIKTPERDYNLDVQIISVEVTSS